MELLDHVLLPYQKRWLDDHSQLKIGMFARQTGKTFSTTLEAVLDCIAGDHQGRKINWTIISVTEDRAKDAMDDGVKRHLKFLHEHFEEENIPFHYNETAFIVKLKGGSRIRCISSRASSARGMSENLILDEFAHHQDTRAIWSAAFPVISRGYQLRVISTPNGKNNMFYTIMSSSSVRWSRHVIDIYQAVKDGLKRDIELLHEGSMDEDLWRQEYELQWMDEASAWLPFELIAQNEHSDAAQPQLYRGGPCFIGIPPEQDLRADLHSVRQVVGPTGIASLRANHEGDGHADRFWAMALAITAADSGPEIFAYEPVPLYGNSRDPDPWGRDMYSSARKWW